MTEGYILSDQLMFCEAFYVVIVANVSRELRSALVHGSTSDPYAM